MQQIFLVPEPDYVNFKDEWIDFKGFKNLPENIFKEFNIPIGDLPIIIEEGDEEEVSLSISSKAVNIRGNKFAGLAYLIQLTRQREGYIPLVEIRKKFKFKIRGFHLDVARGGVPKVETLKRIIKWLFLLNYNALAIYFEDLFPWKTHSDIGVNRGRYSESEFKDIENYANSLGIELIPSLELLGHMENILVGKYSKFAEAYGTLDVSNKEGKEFGLRLLKDALELSKSKYIIVGGDETWYLGRGKSLTRLGQFKGPELYIDYYTEVINEVKSHGKIPILWGDMLTGIYLSEEEKKWWQNVIKHELWNEVIIANWNYDDRDEEWFKWFIDLVGHYEKQLACPGLANWRRFYPDYDIALTNLRNFLKASKKKGLPGFLITAWGDDGEECLFSFLDPLILAGIEIAEGNEKWEDKWLKFSGENPKILQVRREFGKREIAENVRKVVYDDIKQLPQEVLSSFERALNLSEGIILPEDLQFMRNLIRTAYDVLRGKVTVDEYLHLAYEYVNLWLKERKPQGLETVIKRFWGSAGMLELSKRVG